MKWKTRQSEETFGRTRLRLETLESLEQTIDELFAELSRTGNPQLLEDLCPYFGCVWPSARALGQFLEEQPLEKDGARRFLEVGCGLAVPSLILLMATRFSRVSASDFHPEVPRFLKQNLDLNFLAEDPARERFEYLDIDWRHPPAEIRQSFHWIVGSDILYEKTHPQAVADALDRLVHRKGRITIADPGRPYLQTFIDEMKARGWAAEPQVLSVRDFDPQSTKEVFLLDFHPIGSSQPIF